MPTQVTAPPSPYLEARVLNLEQENATLRGNLESFTDMCRDLRSSVGKLERAVFPPTVGSFPEEDLAHSHQRAKQFQQELEELSREVHESVNSETGMQKTNGTAAFKGSGNMPPHLRATGNMSKGTTPLPLHIHSKGSGAAGPQSNNPFVTDGPVDTVATRPQPALSPPLSPVTIGQSNSGVSGLSLVDWRPYYLTTLQPFSSSSIPAAFNMKTFHPEFLSTHLGGTDWSPGLRYIPESDKTCMLKNRTYYLLDPTNEPYLPKKPGEHGVKLTAFFNTNPEEVFGDLPDGASSYEDVPMFVAQKDGRYAYFGNYSQPRWSDKLGYDTMQTRVPQEVKEYWAKELTSPVRQVWVTKELKKHFFPKPTYEGRLHSTPEDDATITSEDEVKLQDKMVKDVKKYVEELREREREANMKTAMVKPQSILDAFDAADADDPPALRLWWEYLECVNWRKDFYDLLVTLQSRNPARYHV